MTAAQAGLEASSTSTQGRPVACSAATTTGSACSWLYTGITAQGLCTGGSQQNTPGGAGGLAVAEGEVQLAARGVETQGQLQLIAGAHQLLELQHFHAAEARRQIFNQAARQLLRPVDLHHARQYQGLRKVAGEGRKVER